MRVLVAPSIEQHLRFAIRRPDGTVECWGSDRAGQLRPPSFELTAVVVGSRNVCGLARDRSAACWNHDEDALDVVERDVDGGALRGMGE